MALERQRIEKKDFPIGRRGYDPEAVDAHLARIAEEVEQLKSANRRRTETLASAASEQVRAIVEAAESSAAEITRQAEEEAYEIRAEANEEAQATRQQASSQARDYVGQVSESTAVMLQRLDAMENELSSLLDSLKTGANRLNADLQLLEGNLEDVNVAVSPRPKFEPEAPGSAPATRPAPVTVAEPELEPELEPEPELFDAAPEDDAEGARLVALNMALNGTPREETERYLAENFSLGDRDGLLDEVYASVEG
jgi:DivIVA domain-containing protein